MRKKVCTLIFVLFVFPSLFAAVSGGLPAKLQAALLVKVLTFNKGINNNAVIHVVGDSALAGELKSAIGKGIVTSVTEGDAGSAGSANVVIVSDASKADAVVAFTRSKKVLSVTGNPDLMNKISLGFGLEDGKPKILLNAAASKEEDIKWNPAILKVAVKM